jgi:hypothetical protein
MKNLNLRKAKPADMKVGTVLITSEGYKFKIVSKYRSGMWNAKE